MNGYSDAKLEISKIFVEVEIKTKKKMILISFFH